MRIKIHESWREKLNEYFNTKEFKKTAHKARQAYLDKSKTIFPHPTKIFNAFNTTPFNQVKVVILGQDPYHNPKQAHGLAFSVPNGVPAPPSLQNILKELHDDLSLSNNHEKTSQTDLTPWAKQGVLLLNSVLTVEKNKPGSHANMGWELFTDKVIQILSNEKKHLVFILWGVYAKSKQSLIDTNKHLALTAPHPSPLSAHKGFFGCRHFSKTNAYLKQNGIEPINWEL